MKSERYDSIEYNDDWESIPVVRAEPVSSYYDNDNNEEDDYEEDYDTYSGQGEGYRTFEDIKSKKTDTTPQPVIKLQFLLAFIVLALAFVLKSYGGELYTTISTWYFDNLNNSLIVTLGSKNDNLSSIEENTENNISATDITEQPEKDIQPDNTPTEPSNSQPTLPSLTEPSTEEATAESTSQPYTTQPQTNEVEDEY